MSDSETPQSAVASDPAFDRGITPVSGSLGGGRGGKLIALAALVLGCGAFLFAARGAPPQTAKPPPDQPARQVVPYEPISVKPATEPLPSPADVHTPSVAPPVPEIAPRTQPARGGPAHAAAPPLLVVDQAPTDHDSLAPAFAATSPPTELEGLRRGSAIDLVQARRLPNRDFLIVAGAVLPCLLQTAMDTDAPGYVTCLVPRPVYSDNGRVVLLEKGTRVIGEYRGGMRQGGRRLFVLWTRAVTPAGIAVDLASPAVDPLGRAGFDGALDTRFWDRFGAALLFSLVDGAAEAASRDEGVIDLSAPGSQAAAIALEQGADIAPSLRKAQGAEVAILVARDVDFSRVYGLRAR